MTTKVNAGKKNKYYLNHVDSTIVDFKVEVNSKLKQYSAVNTSPNVSNEVVE